MKKIKINKIVNKYLDIVSEQCNCEVKECNVKECNLKEQTDQDTLPVGKHNDVPDSNYDQHELEMGIEVEKEHTDNPEFAKAISRDHLAEFPDYYTRLKKMEDEAKEYWKNKK